MTDWCDELEKKIEQLKEELEICRRTKDSEKNKIFDAMGGDKLNYVRSIDDIKPVYDNGFIIRTATSYVGLNPLGNLYSAGYYVVDISVRNDHLCLMVYPVSRKDYP